MATNKTIRITDLQVNTENYRFDTVASQKEAIDKMIDDQGEKVYNLAEHIITNGLNPNDRVQVSISNHDSTKYNVLEGNRRTVAIKLINNPDLIDDKKYSALKKKFRKLHEENISKLLTDIECTVYDNPKEAEVWIGLKHGYGATGISTDNWDALQKDRFQEKTEGKTSVSIQFINLIKKASDAPEEIKKSIEQIDTTNLVRLIGDPDVRDFLGIEINNGVIQSTIEEKEVIKGLTQVAKDLLNPSFTVRKIYNKDDRRDYIRDFPKTSQPDLKKKASKPWQFNGETTSPSSLKKSKSSSKPQPNPTERNNIIPKNCVFKINNQKVNSIYHELQKLDVKKYTNAGSVLLRVFIELSIDCYIEENKLTASPSSAKSGMALQQKTFQVVNHLESLKHADATICKGIKTAVKDSNDILGLDTWHAYVHNNRFSPTPKNLIITWDNIQDFMLSLWSNVK